MRRIDIAMRGALDRSVPVERAQFRFDAGDRRVVGPVDLRDNEPVRKNDLLAGLGGPAERRLAGLGIDQRDCELEVEFAAEGAIGR